MDALVTGPIPVELQQRAEGALLGAAIGDAAGWPQEPAGKRLGKRPEPSGPLFNKWIRRSGNRFLSYNEPIGAGEYSDDTQLILATARSLQHADWWHQFTSVELPFWTMYERGGGGATKRAATLWLNGLKPWAAGTDDAKRYFAAGGNGAAMRVLPHVVVYGERFEPAPILRNAITTHGHPRALVGALLHAWVLHFALRNTQTLSYGALLEAARDSRLQWSGVVPSEDPDWSSAWGIAFGPNPLRVWTSTIDEVDQLLGRALSGIRQGSLANDLEVLQDIGAIGGAVSGAGTVTAVAALYLASRYADEPMLGLRQAAFLPRADTDTIASMAGSILGSLHKTDWLRQASLQLQDEDYIRRFSNPFSSALPHIANTVDHVGAQERARAENELEKLSTGENWSSPDGRSGAVLEVRPLIDKAGRQRATQWVIRIEDGQTIHYSKAHKIAPRTEAEPKTASTLRPVEGSRVGIRLPATDIEKTRWFYGQVLGASTNGNQSGSLRIGGNLVFYSGKPIRTKDPARSSSMIRIFTPSFDEAWDNVRTSQLEVLRPASLTAGRRSFLCEDPSGYTVEVFEDAPPDSEGRRQLDLNIH
jgi:ADP-ribosylglycohydrolase